MIPNGKGLNTISSVQSVKHHCLISQDFICHVELADGQLPCNSLHPLSLLLQRHGRLKPLVANSREVQTTEFTAMAPLPMLSTKTVIVPAYHNFECHPVPHAATQYWSLKFVKLKFICAELILQVLQSFWGKPVCGELELIGVCELLLQCKLKLGNFIVGGSVKSSENRRWSSGCDCFGDCDPENRNVPNFESLDWG